MAMQAWAAGLKVITSKCECCHRSLALRHLSSPKAGIRMDGCWYCSCPCFTSAAETKLSELLTSGLEPAHHVSRMPLGLILISRGLLTGQQLREAIDGQKESGGEIGELLVRHGLVSEKQLTAVRAAQWGCPVFSVSKHTIHPGIQIPSALIQLYSAIPLHHVAATKRLLVGFVDVIEYGLLYAIERITGCKTQACFVTPSDFQIQLQQSESVLDQPADATPKEVMFESVQTPAEMAHILSGYAINLEADEAIIGRCREHLWTRLRCVSKEVDLLFKAR
jgi:hypothetical protein